MDAIIANFKTQMSTLIEEEVAKTLDRLRSKIVEALEVEDDLEIDMTKFAKNTSKKILESDILSDAIEEFKKNGVKKEKKEKKDPDAPKSSVNSYIIFSRENREQVKKENPDIKSTDITKKLAEMWKELDEEDKKEYKEKADLDKKRYEEELENYEPKDGFKNPKKSPKKEKLEPKRARSAYIFFCMEKREEVKKNKPEIKATEILSELGKIWKKLTDKKKKPYEKMAQEDKKRYEEEMKTYVPADGESPKKSKAAKAKDSSPKRAPSAYLIFCKENREEVKAKNADKKMTEITTILGKMWTDLSDKKKKPYTEKAEKLKKEFEAEKDKIVEENEDEDIEEKKSSKKRKVVEAKDLKEVESEVDEDSEDSEDDEDDEDDEDLCEDEDEEEDDEEPKQAKSGKSAKKSAKWGDVLDVLDVFIKY